MADEGAAAPKATPAPPAADPRTPDSPAVPARPSWRSTAQSTFEEFNRDQCTDLAAALTYYSVLAIFPGLLALVSLLGVFGQGADTVGVMMDLLRQTAGSDVADTLRGPVESMVAGRGAGLALVLGIAGAVWSASGYVGAFGRAMNRVYEVDEGRGAVRLRLTQLGITLALIVLAALVLVGLVVSGPVTEAIGNTVGLGDTATRVWSVAKWPAILVLVVVIVAVLYWATPNVRQPGFRWVSVGAAVAIALWILASVAFGFYVSNFGSYNKTYGTLAGVIVFLLWLWITNLALLFGAEIDSELERDRQLRAGIRAEKHLQLPPRQIEASVKAKEKLDARVERGRALRASAAVAQEGRPESRADRRLRRYAVQAADARRESAAEVREDEESVEHIRAAASRLEPLPSQAPKERSRPSISR